MKNIIFIHWFAPKEMCQNLEPLNTIWWFWWLQEKLRKNWFSVYNPLVPNLWDWNYENWKKTFEKLDFNEETTVIAHSAWAAFAVRFLWETNKKINKLILVAPAKFVWEDKTLEEFYNFKISESLKNTIWKVIIFISKDDEPRHLKAVKIYWEKLNVDIITFENKGHFIDEELKEILDYLK